LLVFLEARKKNARKCKEKEMIMTIFTIAYSFSHFFFIYMFLCHDAFPGASTMHHYLLIAMRGGEKALQH